MSCACALRTNSSRSLKLYAGSKEFAAFAGFVGAMLAHVTSVRRIVALFVEVATSISLAFVRVVAEDGIVVEADPHPVGGRGDGSENGRNENRGDDRDMTHRLPP